MAPKPRLAIVITHPIRYVVPLIQLLVKRNHITLKVFYTYGPELLQLPKYQKEHREQYESALPLFDGYDHEWVENTAAKKSTFRFSGIKNPGLIHKISEWKPDAILVNGWNHHSHLQAMRYFKGKIPVHFRGDSTLLDEERSNVLKRTIRRIVLKNVYRHIDKAWYVGSHNHRYFLKMGVAENALEYVPHAVDNERFSRTAANTAQAMHHRVSMGIPLAGNVYLYAGKIKKEKGVFVLLRSFLDMHDENDHLLIVGGGVHLPALKKIAAATKNIHFLPVQPQSNMPVIYSMADVCVLPSESDTWGLVLNEAMANGLAVIASDQCGGAADLIDQGGNGFICKAGDVKALAHAMKAISSDRVLLKQMKESSLERIRDFSFEVQAGRIESILSRL